MSAERAHLRLVGPAEVAPEPADEVWRRGIASARAALAGGRHQRPEVPGTGPGGSSEATGGASFKPRLPSVEAAWAVLDGGHEEGQR